MLLVGNHSGGNLTPDTRVFTLAFSTYFGVERRFHQLAHNLVLSMPGLGLLRKYGTVAATPENAARRSTRRRAARLSRRRLRGAPADLGVGQGGLRRPQGLHPARARAGRADRPGGSIGGQETALFLTPRRAAREAAGARPDVPPQGAADLARAAVGAERRRHARPHPAAGEDHDRGARADRPARRFGEDRTSTRPTTTCSAGCRPRSPSSPRSAAPGDRLMRVERDHRDRRAARADLGARLGPGKLPALHARAASPAGEATGNKKAGLGARYHDAHAGRARRTSAAWSRSSSSTRRRHRLDSVTGIDQRVRWRLRETDDGRTRVSCGCRRTRPAACSGTSRTGCGAHGRDDLEETLKNLALEWTTRRSRQRWRRGRQKAARAAGARARQREGARRGRRDPADAAGPPVGRAQNARRRWGRSPRPGRSSLRRALPRRDDDRRRARARSPSARCTTRTNALAHALSDRGRPRGRRRRGHVPQPPRLHRGDRRAVEARRRRALPQHRLRRPAARRGRASARSRRR